MKNILGVIVLLFGIGFSAQAQDLGKNKAVVSFSTSAKCGMCKKRLEKDLSLTKGVQDAKLNLDDKVMTIVYNSKKTDKAKLQKAINDIGYDAGESVANQKSHDRLPDCCQKDAEEHED